MNWNELRYFIAVGETASVLEAARRLQASAAPAFKIGKLAIAS